MSPLRALRTPGRHSTSDLRASSRRLQAAQQQQQAAHMVSPPLQDAKVASNYCHVQELSSSKYCQNLLNWKWYCFYNDGHDIST